MEYRRFEDTYIVRLDPEEEILTQLMLVAEKENIMLAEISGLGALKELEISVFDTKEKAYYNNTYAEAMELLSLTGTVTCMDGKPYLHVHATAGDGTGKAVGGHLKKAVISVTGEILLRVIAGRVERKFSEAIGINLMHF